MGISNNAPRQSKTAKIRPVKPKGLIWLTADRAEFTVEMRDGRATVEPGKPGRYDSRVETDRSTFEAILGGAPGIEAFLSGRLRVRKNLALALQLDAVLGGRPGPERRGFRAHRTTAAGVDTFFIDAGQGPPVILLHGLGATNASFLPTFWDLARDHHVIAPDLPGHGETAKPIRAYHAGFMARWAVALMDALRIREAVLIGNSMGGRVALEVGFREPDRVERIICLTPAAAFLKYRQWAPVVRLLRPELGLLPIALPRSRVLALTKSLFWKPDRVPEAWHEGATDEFLRVFSEYRGRIAFLSCLREIYLDAPYGKRGFWERLHTLEPPALFVWGDHDRLVPAAFARHVSRELPNARSVVMRSCGHVPQFEQPARTQRLIRDFLGEVEQAA
ncbi:MAG TPA: alpha/beta fold hydrolase [Solirubrobacterales bacterium]|nr:alpha/beta fold hydrolase [Solirubrobacterales bacterium]